MTTCTFFLYFFYNNNVRFLNKIKSHIGKPEQLFFFCIHVLICIRIYISTDTNQNNECIAINFQKQEKIERVLEHV